MDGDDNYMFWVVRVNDLFMANNKRWKHDWMICTVSDHIGVRPHEIPIKKIKQS